MILSDHLEEEEPHIFMAYSIKLLKIHRMWPSSCNKKNISVFLKENFVTIIIAITTLPLVADFITSYKDGNLTFNSFVEQLVAFTALCSVVYISVCFSLKKEKIKNLVETLNVFENFCPRDVIIRTEASIKFYTKCFILYGVVGNVFYAVLPILSYKNCMENRTSHMMKYGISCGLIARYVLPFKFNYSPVFELVLLQQFLASCSSTIIIMTITMLVSGLLMHCSAQLIHLSEMILNLDKIDERLVLNQVKLCVKYHTAIIDYSEKINSYFKIMMLLHIVGTSFIISVLGFVIIKGQNYFNTIRFLMHLAGWMGILFIISYYGQTLMDKSRDVSTAVYTTKWYQQNCEVRKYLCLILLRAQRPLCLKAAGVKPMSFATFLGVLSTAYSYFTLLINVT